jgi:hypothetical protein
VSRTDLASVTAAQEEITRLRAAGEEALYELVILNGNWATDAPGLMDWCRIDTSAAIASLKAALPVPPVDAPAQPSQPQQAAAVDNKPASDAPQRLARILADLQGLMWEAQSDASQDDLLGDARLILSQGPWGLPDEAVMVEAGTVSAYVAEMERVSRTPVWVLETPAVQSHWRETIRKIITAALSARQGEGADEM